MFKSKCGISTDFLRLGKRVRCFLPCRALGELSPFPPSLSDWSTQQREQNSCVLSMAHTFVRELLQCVRLEGGFRGSGGL